MSAEPAEMPPRITLRRSISFVDIVMLGAGSALGFAIFSALGPAAQIGGSGILITIVISALPMAVFGVVYAFMASASPRSGASFEWPREYIHPFVGFMLSWLRIFGSVGQLTTIAVVLVQYLSMAVALPVKPAMFALFTAIFLLNLRGVKVAARAQTLLMSLLIGVFALFIVTGAPAVRAANILPLMPHGIWPILLAAPLMINLFMGIESATEVSEEVHDAERNVPLSIGLSLLLIAVVYLGVTFTAVGLIGADALGASKAPLVDAARRAVGGLALPLMLGAALLSLVKAMNASFLIFSRSFFAMGRAGVLPRQLANLSGPNETPRLAIVTSYICLCTGLFLPQGLVFLFLASNIPTILKYLCTCTAALAVVQRRPDVYAKARLRLSRPVVRALSIFGMLLALGLFALGYESDWRPYALVGGWAGVGLIYWFVDGRRRHRLTNRAQQAGRAA